MPVEKERRHFVSIGNVLTLITIIGGIAGVYAANAADNADTKRRVTTLEAGEQKTHQLIKENAGDIKRDVKSTQEKVDLILIELRAMQAVQRERERRDRTGRQQ